MPGKHDWTFVGGKIWDIAQILLYASPLCSQKAQFGIILMYPSISPIHANVLHPKHLCINLVIETYNLMSRIVWIFYIFKLLNEHKVFLYEDSSKSTGCEVLKLSWFLFHSTMKWKTKSNVWFPKVLSFYGIRRQRMASHDVFGTGSNSQLYVTHYVLLINALCTFSLIWNFNWAGKLLLISNSFAKSIKFLWSQCNKTCYKLN